MSKEERFIIDCYGIIDTNRPLTGYCEKDRLSWRELCDTLNRLYESCDEDNESLMMQNELLKKENEDLKYLIKKIREQTGEIE